jgi:hypothetical protein
VKDIKGFYVQNVHHTIVKREILNVQNVPKMIKTL